jgi:hypothetical protein
VPSWLKIKSQIPSLFVFCFATLSGFLFSCNNSKGPDVSKIKVDIKIERFEQSFFSIDTNNLQTGLQKLNPSYPGFTTFFLQQIIGLNPNANNDTTQKILKQIFSSYHPINDSIQKKYPDLNWLKKDLEEGFKHVKLYYPSYKVPNILTYIATFDAPGVVYTPHYLAIGLQQYAGKNFSAYKDPEIQGMYPEYISRRFDKEYMAANVMKSVVDDIYPDTTDNAKLIELIIEKGKQWWLLDKFLPNAPDSVKTGYTKRQTEWVNANEGNIWGSIISNTPDLYTIDVERIQNYIGESPFTQNMEASNSSPGNIGQWVGWQIVKKFEEKNSGLTVQQVLATPAAKIFQEAKYRPK